MANFTGRVRRVMPPDQRTRFGKVGSFPLNIKPTRSEPMKLKGIEPDDKVTVMRRGWRFTGDKREELERRAVPISEVYGSLHERIIYKELVKRKIRFDFQSSMLGGRMELGGLAADFILPDYGDKNGLIIEPNGIIWHTGVIPEANTKLRHDLLAILGYDLVMMWDWEVEDKIIFEQWWATFVTSAYHTRINSPQMVR